MARTHVKLQTTNLQTTRDRIQLEFKRLLDDQQELLELAQDLKNVINFGTRYQSWYSRALKLIELLGPDRINEFRSYYEIDPKRKYTDAGNYVIQDYVKGIGARETGYPVAPLFDIHNILSIRIVNQIQILRSLNDRIDSILDDIEGRLFAGIQDAELDTAQQLRKVNLRAAGAIAGVVLERHLRRAADNHGVKIKKKNPTIADLNDPLRDVGVYDLPMWRKVQYLADIRNLCSHDKQREPSKDEVDELISGVNQIIGTVF